MHTIYISQSALDARARRAAKRAGLIARRSRWRWGTVDNHGQFMVVDPRSNCVVAGGRFNLSAQEVIAFCT
jgi:hypothetical protein